MAESEVLSNPLIQKYRKLNEELNKLVENHIDFEKQIHRLHKAAWLSSLQRDNLKQLKIQKLYGKEKIESLVREIDLKHR